MLIDKITRNANYNTDPIVYEINNPENATFQIADKNYTCQLLLYQKKIT